MKKSNKILLGGFLTVLLIVAGIHIALFAKYKNGNYIVIPRKVKEENERMQRFPNVSFVSIRNVHSAAVRFGDTATVEKDREGLIKTEQKGDSLIIIGQSFIDERSNARVHASITLPYNVTIETDSVSMVSLQSYHLLKAKITTVSSNP